MIPGCLCPGPRHRRGTLALVVAIAALGLPGIGQAQGPPAITSDGTTGTSVTRAGEAYTIGGGTIRSTNLFHSFCRFNVPAGGSATFTGPLSIRYIISRVTGGEASTIAGLISSRASMPNASFVLINPSGVHLESGARLDVGGSVHLSTANEVRFADGSTFSARPVPGEVLTTAAPTAFGFLGPIVAPISVDGSLLTGAADETLSLVGGDVTVTGGARLTASGGRVQIASVASEGQVPLDVRNFDVSSFSRLGEVRVSGGSVLNVSGNAAGAVYIRGGRLVMDNATAAAVTANADGAPVGIDVHVTGEIALTGRASLLTRTTGAGRSGAIALTADSLDLSGSSTVVTSSQSLDAAGGPIAVTARSVTMAGGARVESRAERVGAGGDIVFDVGRLSLMEGAKIGSTAGFAGPAGTLTVTAKETVSLSGAGTEIFSTSLQRDVPTSPIVLDVGRLSITDGAQILSGRLGEQGGDVRVTARDSIFIGGGGGILSQAFTRDGGVVTVSAPVLSMDNGFISTRTQFAGAGGDVAINVNQLTLTRGAEITSSSVGAPTTGRGGNIRITAEDVRLQGGSRLAASSDGTGNAGNINLVIGDSLRLDGSAITTAAAQAAGGAITIASTGSFVELKESQITTSVQSGVGGGGNVTIGSESRPLGALVLDDSQILARAFAGPGGNMLIVADVFLTSGSIVDATSVLGVPGRIDIQAKITDVSGNLARLPEAVPQVASLLRAACSARLAGGQASSLVVSGREGLPVEPGSVLPSPLVIEDPAHSPRSHLEPASGRGSIRSIALWPLTPGCSR